MHAATRFPKQCMVCANFYKDDIAKAMLVANPGCYPTCVSLPLLPLLQAGRLKANAPLIADCKSGVSGAGRKASTHALLCEAGDNFKAYGVVATAICLKSDKPCPDCKAMFQTA